MICDVCGADLCDNTEFSCIDEESLDIEMREHDWLQIDDKTHYCSSCTEWDEDYVNRVLKNQNK